MRGAPAAGRIYRSSIACIDFANRPTLMNEPMREMDALIADRRLYHDGDPLFAWMLSNVVNRTRTGDIHSPAKERAENKIDGPVAHMMALGRWLKDEDGSGSLGDYLASLEGAD